MTTTFDRRLTLALGIVAGIGLSEIGTRTAAEPNVSRVLAPFEVANKDGTVILRVSDEPADVAAKSGARVIISRGSGANYVLHFRTPKGSYAASVGESSAGIGVIHLHDDAGQVRARADGKSGYLLFSPTGTIVANLGLGSSSAGFIELMDSGGTKMVEAGIYPDGVGRVLVGPAYRCGPNPGALGLGIPDCIVGRKKK